MTSDPGGTSKRIMTAAGIGLVDRKRPNGGAVARSDSRAPDTWTAYDRGQKSFHRLALLAGYTVAALLCR